VLAALARRYQGVNKVTASATPGRDVAGQEMTGIQTAT
jgi:hypothetical protein